MEEIKAITESTSCVLSKSCKLCTVKEVLDYLKENKLEVEIDLDLTKYPTTVIDENAFANSTNIKSLRFPDNLASIGDLAFTDCSNLTSVTIPTSVTKIESYIFDGCESITNIIFENTTSKWYWGETEEGVPMSKDSTENAKLIKSEGYSVLLSEKYISN